MNDITDELAEALRRAEACMTNDGVGKQVREALRLEMQAKPAKPAKPVAWRTFDGEGGYEYRSYADNEDYASEWAERNPKHIGWVEALFAAPVAQAEPMDMALCEATRVVLREGQLYRFRRVGDCETCAELSKQSLEAYGKPPKENQP